MKASTEGRLAFLRGSGFYPHLAAYVVVNIGLAIYVAARSVDFPMWYWIPIAWGLALVAKAAGSYWYWRRRDWDDRDDYAMWVE